MTTTAITMAKKEPTKPPELAMASSKPQSASSKASLHLRLFG